VSVMPVTTSVQASSKTAAAKAEIQRPATSASTRSIREELGIPADADVEVYSPAVMRDMQAQGLDYETVERLLAARMIMPEVLAMPSHQRAVRSYVLQNPGFAGTLDELLEWLPGEASSIVESYPDAVQKVQYGTSVQGRSLDAYILKGCDEPDKRIILTFAVHGYEGIKKNDGAYLSENALKILRFYAEHPDLLGSTELIICPMLNPDGVYMPAKVGYGRGQSQWIDMNRDFIKDGGFRAAESRAFRDFLHENEPDILIDFHGWLNGTYGDAELAEIFLAHTGLTHTDTYYGSKMGYLIGYAHSMGARAMLVEYKHYEKIDTEGVLNAINELCAFSCS